MIVTIKYLAPICEMLKRTAEEVKVEESATLRDLIELISIKYGRHVKDHFFDDKMEFRPKFLISINGEVITNLHIILRDGDHIYFIQPIAGG